jgi:hypothetical protein
LSTISVAKTRKGLSHQRPGKRKALERNAPQGCRRWRGQILEIAHQGAADRHELGVAGERVTIAGDNGQIFKPGFNVPDQIFEASVHPVAYHDPSGSTGEGQCVIMVVAQIGTLSGMDGIEQSADGSQCRSFGLFFGFQADQKGERILFDGDAVLVPVHDQSTGQFTAVMTDEVVESVGITLNGLFAHRGIGRLIESIRAEG